jgi:hypothetical protein
MIVRFEVALVEAGLGRIPGPGMPPAAAWGHIKLKRNGQPVLGLPRLEVDARDREGKGVRAELQVFDREHYVVVRTGFQRRTGPIRVEISYRGASFGTFELPALPPARREFRVLGRPDPRFRIVRLKNDASPLGLVCTQPPADDDAYIVRYVGTAFGLENPVYVGMFLPQMLSQRAGLDPALPIPLPVAYPEEAEAVRLEVQHVRATKWTRTMVSEGRLQGVGDRLAIMPSPFVGEGGRFGGYVATSAVLASRHQLFLRSLDATWAGRAQARLLSPGAVNGKPLELILANLLSRSTSTAPKADDIYGKAGTKFPIRIAIDGWRYRTTSQRNMDVPVPEGEQPVHSDWHREIPPFQLLQSPDLRPPSPHREGGPVPLQGTSVSSESRL